MSGKPEPTGAKPQAPKLFKPGKFKVTMALEPKLEGPTAAQLTVIPSGIEAKAEDKGPAPVYTSVALRQGMFTSTSVKATAAPSGTSVVKKEVKKGVVDVSAPLAPNFDKGEEEEVLEEEERALPPPPPQKPAARLQERPSVLPAVAKAYLGLPTQAAKKSYTQDAIKERMTEAMAKTLVEVNTQLKVAAGKGMDLRKETGVTKETKEGITTYTLSQPFQEKDGLTEAGLQSLDDLFKTMRIRLTTISGEGSLDEASTSQLAKDYIMMMKLIPYASKYKEEDVKRREKEERNVLKDMMTAEIADTLLALETKLTELSEFGITFDSMEITFPESESDPYIYSFEDGNTLLDVAETPEAKKEADRKLGAISSLLPGRTKLSLTKIIGNGSLDEEGSPLKKDIEFLTTLFEIAKEIKEKKVAPVVAAKEEVISLEGTPYEALAEPIEAESSKAPYEITTDSKYKPGSYPDKTGKAQVIPEQKGFIPQTRRAFGYFIYDKYRRYMLDALKELDPDACQKLGGSSNLAQIYEYQKFVRDYISFMTPYRGVLVYHGLGSGKTCTAIAASEALLASGGKRIIVMTPFSLRKNFIQQITFCGFRHYRLLNYWTSYEYKISDKNNALWLFATSVLKIPESYLVPKKGKAMRIWIPDLNKPQSEQNYTSLPADQQSEIRNQIYETLVYDPKKKKNGLIWFINYNGIPASQLRDLACKDPPNAFDNAVIVIDEIHNLVRLMQGTVDSYLKKMYEGQLKYETKGDPKYLDPERITSDKWRPKNCGGNASYKRGYLFYRLLLQAKNTKIIGLSGTPLINFPEELGILANVLHGYNFLYTANLDKVVEKGGNEKILDGLKKLGEGTDPSNFCPYLDFYEITEVITSDRKVKIQFNFTLLPEGYQRIPNQLGVERIPFTEEIPTVNTRLLHVKECINKILKSVNTIYIYNEEFKERAEPLLPVMGEPSIPENEVLDDSFKGRFVNPADGVSIKNAQVLMKRLSGLISYYKGSRKDLMPEVKPGDDVVVRVPMSLEQQRKYIAIRLGEIKIEKQKESAQRGAPEALAGPQRDDAELKKLSSSQNYRMASRQACNFTFPDGFTRPRPLNAKEAKEADELGGTLEVLGGEEETSEESALVRTIAEEKEESQQEKEDAEKVAKEDEAISLEQERLEIEQKKEELKGKSAGDIAKAIAEIQARYAIERSGGILVAEKSEEEVSKDLTPEQKRCLANKIDDRETYQMAINRSKECLLEYGLPKLRVEDPDRPGQSPLAKCSTKYKAMIDNISRIPGSSLVYSQFLSMEGIGLFTIVLQANGYVPIKIVSRGGQYEFDEATEASIRKGPAQNENRFILFTGGEDEDVRKVNIDLFNAKFSELPSKIKSTLQESGFTEEIGNKRGDLCRVFCITAAGAEGLSLKNVRGVHIMEPYWNDVRMAQVKGRAVRICSHQELPLEDRNVKIFTYLSVFDPIAEQANPDDADNPWSIPLDIWTRDFLTKASADQFGLTIASTKGEYAMTSDERLYFISERKKQLVENLIIVMKTAAADCLLNYNENRDGTFICRLLGNEGDFLYHPNLQKDIEMSENENSGDIFKVDEAEKKRIQEEDAALEFKLVKKAEKEGEAVVVVAEEEAKPKAAAVVAEEEEKPKAAAVVVEEEKPKAEPVVVAPPERKKYVYPVVITQKQYKVIGEEDASGVVPKFFVYNESSKKVGEAQAEKVKDKWIPKKGTVKFNKK